MYQTFMFAYVLVLVYNNCKILNYNHTVMAVWSDICITASMHRYTERNYLVYYHKRTNNFDKNENICLVNLHKQRNDKG